MGKKDKPGFNSPFGQLKTFAADQAAKAEATKAESAKKAAAASASKKAAKTPPRPVVRDGAELSADEADEFLRAVSSVAPLGSGSTKRVEPEKRKESALPDDDALALAELQALVEGDTPFHVVESEEFYSGQAPGVSHELVEKLREGAFSYRRHVDLHGYTRDDGKVALTDFIAAARRDGERCVLVVTGRGKSSPGGISVLREALPRWLGRFPLRSHVLAYCTARSVDGGPGAFYVLLRKMGSRPFGGP